MDDLNDIRQHMPSVCRNRPRQTVNVSVGTDRHGGTADLDRLAQAKNPALVGEQVGIRSENRVTHWDVSEALAAEGESRAGAVAAKRGTGP
ncbi:MAG: hypothetical protein Devi2KO_00840 [Devosia indica]